MTHRKENFSPAAFSTVAEMLVVPAFTPLTDAVPSPLSLTVAILASSAVQVRLLKPSPTVAVSVLEAPTMTVRFVSDSKMGITGLVGPPGSVGPGSVGGWVGGTVGWVTGGRGGSVGRVSSSSGSVASVGLGLMMMEKSSSKKPFRLSSSLEKLTSTSRPKKVSEKKAEISEKYLPLATSAILNSGHLARLRFSLSEKVGRSVWPILSTASTSTRAATRISISLSMGLCFNSGHLLRR